MFRVTNLLVGIGMGAAASNDNPKAFHGPFTVKFESFPLNSDIRNPNEDMVSIWYPTGVNADSNATFDDTTSFKFISYAHGMFGGGIVDVPGYNELLTSMASFGYIIGATHQCDVGCFDDCNSLPHDPVCFGNYYKKQLSVIDWAKACSAYNPSCSTPFTHVDFSQGVGIAGHSMGGQATLFSSSYGNASDYDIRAAVMHHAYTHSFPTPTIPFLAFTGEEDTTAPPDTMGLPIYKSADGSGVVRGYVDKTYAGHHEPDITSLDRNGIELIAQFSAAWFKLYLDNTPVAFGVDFDAMIYGKGSEGMCSGGDGAVTACTFD
jgi:hypothetical protein